MARKKPQGNAPVPEPITPHILTRELIDQICRPLLIGVPFDFAASLFNIHGKTVRYWVLMGFEHPDSIYGDFVNRVRQAVAEYVARDLSVIEMHSQGRPAQYEMEPAVDGNGNAIYDKNGQPVMRVAKDGNGYPIVKSSEIKSDWRAASSRLSMRLPIYFRSREDAVDHDSVLSTANIDREKKPVEAMTFDQKIVETIKKLEEEY